MKPEVDIYINTQIEIGQGPSMDTVIILGFFGGGPRPNLCMCSNGHTSRTLYQVFKGYLTNHKIGLDQV
jgi:hypothetical protein